MHAARIAGFVVLLGFAEILARRNGRWRARGQP
jgi:hypothetical protein